MNKKKLNTTDSYIPNSLLKSFREKTSPRTHLSPHTHIYDNVPSTVECWKNPNDPNAPESYLNRSLSPTRKNTNRHALEKKDGYMVNTECALEEWLPEESRIPISPGRRAMPQSPTRSRPTSPSKRTNPRNLVNSQVLDCELNKKSPTRVRINT